MLKPPSYIKKILLFLAVLIFIILVFSHGPSYNKKEIKLGATFSVKKAQELGLDWKETYRASLKDLDIKRIRIPAYWDEVEPKNDHYQWKELDWQLQQAKKENAQVILAVGKRLPRWPECHFPDWTNWNQGSSQQKWRSELLEYIEKTVNRYKDHPNVMAWQVENEPYLSSYFGKCPKTKEEFLDKEIELVKKLDSRPIVITDSGELSLWVPAARRANIFGTTMYKNTYSETLGSYVHYPISPDFFHFKKNVADLFTEPNKWIVIELQAEPWGPTSYQNLSEKEKRKTMTPAKMENMIEFASEAGFRELYLWGVEYWYWEKVKNNDPHYWEKAKKLFQKYKN